MAGFTFLTNEQVDTLDVLKKYGTKCAVTDYSILLGAEVSVNKYSSDEDSLKYRTGLWWTTTKDGVSDTLLITDEGISSWYNVSSIHVGARPVIKYEEVIDKVKNKKENNEVIELEYGEYPHTILDEENSKELEWFYENDWLTKTEKSYTYVSSNKINKIDEYLYNGNKYVRINCEVSSVDKLLSDARRCQKDINYWVKVEPITWLLDEKTGLLISKYILFAGVPFKISGTYLGNFDITDIKKYMDNYLINEIIPSEIKKEEEINFNPYNFEFDDVKEEEIIKGYIESDIPVFLHGKSGDGKSDRVKSIDKDLTILYLRNSSVESICGKSVYNEKEDKMIDVKPTWLIKLEEKCEKEPDKLHILFLDELTNALPSIQGIAFNIVLNKEVNGIWELPKNVRIVAAGNELEDSLSANEIAEPLYGRFAHVYIKTDVNDWLKWAKEANIHPSIVAYIAYKKDAVLRSKYDGVKPNADPRKWEMASKVLYKTSNPEMLKGLVGEDITKEFILFCSQKIITLEDVLNDNYSDDDLDMNTSEKYMTTVGLLSAKKQDYEVVKKFLLKLGKEFLIIFNSLWIDNYDEIYNEKIKKKN